MLPLTIKLQDQKGKVFHNVPVSPAVTTAHEENTNEFSQLSSQPNCKQSNKQLKLPNKESSFIFKYSSGRKLFIRVAHFDLVNHW